MSKILKLLMATTFLTAVSAVPAAAVVVFEESSTATDGDFDDSPPGEPIDTSLFTDNVFQVNGRTGRRAFSSTPAEPADFFTFTGLNEGDSFWVTVLEIDQLGDSVRLSFDIAGGTPSIVTPDEGVPAMSAGIVGAGEELTIGVIPDQLGVFEFYEATLEIHAVPEPATLTLFGAGLLGASAVQRRRRRRGQ